VEQINARSIFSAASGYVQRGGFDWTCNPYVGCNYGCAYCYAAFLPQNKRPREDWGRWIQAKVNAVELARRDAHRVTGQAIYLSTVTDPYVPAERSLELTRGILQELLAVQPRLLVQTRSLLVVRDIDLLRDFRSVRVNVSIPTDSEAVWRAFEPKSPRLEWRWQALEVLKGWKIPIGVCLTPLLPLEDPERFLERLMRLDPDVLVTQHFHDAGTGFGADTAESARDLLSRWNWGEEDYRRCLQRLRQARQVYEAEAGFFPPA
jgi:DNA repair photolyase